MKTNSEDSEISNVLPQNEIDWFTPTKFNDSALSPMISEDGDFRPFCRPKQEEEYPQSPKFIVSKSTKNLHPTGIKFQKKGIRKFERS